MRMFIVELKRILSSRRTLIILGIGLIMSTLMGILPITYETINYTLFISAKARTSLTAILISVVTALLPTIVYAVVGTSWLVYILPSSGIGMQNSLLYQLVDINFLPMGNAGVWTPYMIIGGAVVELIVFLMLSVYSYCRHRVG